MKFFIPLVLGAGLMYCKSDQTTMETLQDHVQSYLKSKGHDLTSEEFTGLTDLDTVTEKDYLDGEVESLTLSLTNKAYRIKMMDSVENEFKKVLIKNPNDSTALTNLRDIETTRATLVKQQHALDSLNSVVKPEMAQKIKFLTVKYAFSNKNNAGPQTQHVYFIKLDEKLNVTDVVELNH